jgi:Zn-dependent peptidase ImmA (M78 family)
MNYQTTLLEDWIKNFYQNLSIFHPHQLNLHDISYRLGYSITYKDISSRFYNDEVIIDERLNSQEQWQDFGHELCHALRHNGNQLIMSESFLKMQEYQANNFMYHFCIPTFMLLNFDFPYLRIHAIKRMANAFNVTFEFADKRLEMFENKLTSELFHQEYLKMIEDIPSAKEPAGIIYLDADKEKVNS